MKPHQWKEDQILQHLNLLVLLKAAVLVVEAAVVEGVVDEAEVEGVKITTLLIPQKKMQLLLLQPRTMTLQKQISRKRKLPMFNQKHEIMVAEDVVAEDVLEVVAEVVEAEAEAEEADMVVEDDTTKIRMRKPPFQAQNRQRRVTSILQKENCKRIIIMKKCELHLKIFLERLDRITSLLPRFYHHRIRSIQGRKSFFLHHHDSTQNTGCQ